MPKDIFDISKIEPIDIWGRKTKKTKKRKRKTLTPAQRIYIWERPKKYGRTCSICHEKIIKLSNLELDHTRAYSKGGTKLALAHKECNRLKSSGSLKQIQDKLGIGSKRPRRISKKKKAEPKVRAIVDIMGRTKLVPKSQAKQVVNLITGKKEWILK